VVNPPIWRAFVEEALRGRPGGDFSPPGGLVAVRVDLLSGVPSPSGVPVYVPKGKEPEAPLPAPAETVTLALDRRTNCLAGPDTPPEEVVWLEVPKEEEGKYRCP
jgi:membrane carboxypeptidase/penicillin-binding protein